MKGLRELALSCLLFGCAVNTMATEIADNLLTLDPLVYFGAESFEENEVKGLNGGQADASLSLSSNAPTTVPSFLGEHAGQALQLNGDTHLDLSGAFLSESNIAPGLVLGFFARQNDEPSATTQCLLSIGDSFAMVLDEGSFKAYEQGDGGRIVGSPDVSGLDDTHKAMFLVFSNAKVEIYRGFDKVWDYAVPGGVVSLSEASIILGNCAAQVKETLVQQAIIGFEGQIDELVVISNDEKESLRPLTPAQSLMPTPAFVRAAPKIPYGPLLTTK